MIKAPIFDYLPTKLQYKFPLFSVLVPSASNIATGICVITVYVSLVWMSVLSDIIVLITYVAWSTMCMWLVHWVTAESWNHVIGCFPGIPGNDSGIDGGLSLSGMIREWKWTLV